MASVAQDSLRIVLFIREPMGTLYTSAQNVIRERGHRLVAVVTSAGPRARRTDRYQEIVAQTPLSTDVIVSNFPSRWAGMLAPLEPDLILILGWSWKLPAEVLALPRVGTINWHGALLPNYRGRGDWALQWMLRNDEPNYGITFHWADADWDTGPVLARAVDAAIALLPEVIDMAARGEPGTPQPEGGGFYCDPVEPEWRTIDWNTPARTVHNQVRSWLGQGAFATVDGTPVSIIKTRLASGSGNGAAPGTVIVRGDESMLIQCSDRPIEVLAYSEL